MPFEESLASDSRGIGLGMLPGARWAVIMTNPSVGWVIKGEWLGSVEQFFFRKTTGWLFDVGDDILPSYEIGLFQKSHES